MFYQLFQCFIHAVKPAVKLFRETLPVPPTVRFMSAVMHDDMANNVTATNFRFLPGRDTADFVSSGRLREVKNNRKFETVIS